jgi:multicomponent Na+:H+ antiporter subunit B
MNSLILRTTIRLLLPLLVLFSIFLLGRGHNEPGGGFAGGLVASAGFALYSLAYDAEAARRILHLDPIRLAAIGLLAALTSGLVGWLAGAPFLTGVWLKFSLPGLGEVDLGTPLLFDIGVYLLVTGVILSIVFTMEEAR